MQTNDANPNGPAGVRALCETSTIASPNLTQSWTLDALGNWAGFSQANSNTTLNGGALTTCTQTRTQNAANEIAGTTGTCGTGGSYDILVAGNYGGAICART